MVTDVDIFFVVSEEEEHNCDLQYVPQGFRKGVKKATCFKHNKSSSFVHYILAFLTLRFA